MLTTQSKRNPIISASILSADFTRLGEEVAAVLSASIDQIHFDVMDHHFVPNLSFGAVICKSLRKAGFTMPIDVHLMVDTPELYIEPFAKAGANLLTFHPETVADVAQTVRDIKAAGLQAGLAFNPEAPVDIELSLLKQLDMILLMSVNPGFGGQAFIEGSLKKIQQTRQLLAKYQASAYLGIDGGIKVDNIQAVYQAGADFFVVGSGLFAAADYSTQVAALRAPLKCC